MSEPTHEKMLRAQTKQVDDVYASKVVLGLIIRGPKREDWASEKIVLHLRWLQLVVGGYIEYINAKKYSLIFNEEGLHRNMPKTIQRTGEGRGNLFLVGPILVVGPIRGSNSTRLTAAGQKAFEEDWRPAAEARRD